MKIINSNFNVHQQSFIGTQPHQFWPVLSMTVFMIQWQSGVAVTGKLSQSPKYLLAHITIILCPPVPKLLYLAYS